MPSSRLAGASAMHVGYRGGFPQSCGWVAAFFLAIVSRLAVAADAPPRVIGFERHYTTDSANAVAGGQLLLGELNCTSCHEADAALATQIVRKPAPVLDTVASRVKPQYLLKFLA